MADQDAVPEWKKQAFRMQETALVSYLKSLRFGSVLEVGCGYGRILKVIRHNFSARLIGVDLSRDQLRNARAYINDPTVELREQRGQRMEFADAAFDVVLTCNVLLHISPRKLNGVLREIMRVSRDHVVLIEPVKGDNGKFRSTYCWDHDYASRLTSLGVRSLRQQMIPFPADAPQAGHNRLLHWRRYEHHA